MRPLDAREVAVVEEHGMGEELRRRVDEELRSLHRAREVREDRLQAQVLQLQLEPGLPGGGEEHLGRLQLAPQRTADEGLVAEHRLLADVHHRLEHRPQLPARHQGPELREQLLLLLALARAELAGGLLQAAQDVARGADARVVRHLYAARVDAHEVHRRAAQALPQALHGPVAEPAPLLLQPRAVLAVRPRGQVEEQVEAVGAVELEREQPRLQRRRVEVRPQALGRQTQNAVVQLPSVEALDAGESAELEVDHAQGRYALVVEVRERMDLQARDAVGDQALEAKPLDRLDLGRPHRRRRLDAGAAARDGSLAHDPPSVFASRVRDRTLSRSASRRKGLGRWSEPPTCMAVIRSRTSVQAVRKRTGTSRVCDWRRTISQNSQPSRFGMRTSRTMRSGGASSTLFSAEAPSVAVSTR